MPIPRGLTQFSRHEIPLLYKKAELKFKKNGLEIRLAPRSLNDYGRILIVIPRTSGNAVKRNLIRRRIKSIFYEEKLFQAPFDWIIFVKKDGIEVEFGQLKDIMTHSVQISQ